MESKEIIFKTEEKQNWIKLISEIQANYSNYIKYNVIIHFDNVETNNLEPFHLVTLACLIHLLYNNGIKVSFRSQNTKNTDLLFKDLCFQKYFSGEENHTDSNSEEVLNLWRIIDNEKENYAYSVGQYLKREYFNDKDLSGITSCLQEAFYNVFDHADAKGNAFTLTKYKEESNILQFGICDFGKGIIQSVRNYDSKITNNIDVLKMQ